MSKLSRIFRYRGSAPKGSCFVCGVEPVLTRIGWVCQNKGCELYDPLAISGKTVDEYERERDADKKTVRA